MANEDIRQYSMADIEAMRERGETYTKPQAPTFAVDEDFWANARVVEPKTKDTISLRVDHDMLEWFKAQGKGHLTRMHTVLRSYYEAHRKAPPAPR